MAYRTSTVGLDDYCKTDKESKILDAVRNHASIADAAGSLGYSGDRSVYVHMARIRSRARADGWDPGESVVGDGEILSGKSTLLNAHGEPILTWVKTKADAQLQARLMDEAKQALMDALPREKALPPTKGKKPDDLLNLYIVTDYHIGMKAWPEETGADWDTKIAEELLYAWFKRAIKDAPAAGTAILGQLGDFLHWDGIEAITPSSRHILDADTRFQKLVRVAIRLTRRVVRQLLKKHDHVHIVMAEGNHDPASSMWLREIFNAWYEDEPRVTVDDSPDPYYCYEFGQTSLFFHHGHKRAVKSIDDVFVAKFRDVFGRTRFSYGHMGHKHHDKVIETALMHVEQHRTLAAPDAYASSYGFMSGRSAPVITYSKDYGQVARIDLTPEML